MADKNIKEGDEVSWNWGSGQPKGTAAEIKTDGKLEIESKGKLVHKNASEDNPAVHVERQGNDVVKRESELTKLSDGPGHKDDGEDGKVQGNKADAKAEEVAADEKDTEMETEKADVQEDETKGEKRKRSPSVTEDKANEKDNGEKAVHDSEASAASEDVPKKQKVADGKAKPMEANGASAKKDVKNGDKQNGPDKPAVEKKSRTPAKKKTAEARGSAGKDAPAAHTRAKEKVETTV